MRMSRKTLVITVVAFFMITAVIFTMIFGKNAYKSHIKSKVLAYEQETNEDGIAVDMLDNPYFAQKQPGYSYKNPDVVKYYSGVTDTYRHATVILPNDYDSSKEYPVLYLLHGLGGSHRTWINKDADIIIHNLNYFYGVPDMIVVLPNSEVNEKEDADGLPIEERIALYDKTEEDMINYLMPYIEDN